MKKCFFSPKLLYFYHIIIFSGDLKLWNLKEESFAAEIPDPKGEQGLFRKSGDVVSLSQSQNIAAVAYADKTIALFSVTLAQEAAIPQMELLTLIHVKPLVGKADFIRNIHLTEGQLFVCNVAEKIGIFVLDIWK